MSDLFCDSGAELSPCRKHRYALWRRWDKDSPRLLCIGVNPSKADEICEDRTISRCITFARDWGYGGLYFANLYSFRTPYMKGPLTEKQKAEGWSPLIDNLDIAVGEKCNEWLMKMISESEKVICAWGSWKFAGFDERAKDVLSFIPEPYCLGRNADGQPKHPLYLRADTQPIKYEI